MQDNRKIGIIGCGNMGLAIADKIKSKYQVWVFDKDKDKIKDLVGINTAIEIADLFNQTSVIIFAIKPQDFDIVLKEVKKLGNSIKDKLIISIAAGITISYIKKYLGNDMRLVRIMPNLPARIGMGMSCLCKSEDGFTKDDDLEFAQELFGNLGETLVISEDKIDAATAISGSGPGYFYDLIEGKDKEEVEEYLRDDFIPSLKKTAEGLGFTSQQAEKLAKTTGEGSLSFLERSDQTPSELKKQVASKGGTTESGLEVLAKGGTLEEAAKAALGRAKQLSIGDKKCQK